MQYFIDWYGEWLSLGCRTFLRHWHEHLDWRYPEYRPCSKSFSMDVCFDAFMKQVNMYWFVFSEIYLHFLCQQVYGVLFLGFLINDVIDYKGCNIILKSERSYECCCYLPFNLLYKRTTPCECICCTSGLLLDILGGQEECVWTPSNSLHKPLIYHEAPLLPYVFSS